VVVTTPLDSGGS